MPWERASVDSVDSQMGPCPVELPAAAPTVAPAVAQPKVSFDSQATARIVSPLPVPSPPLIRITLARNAGGLGLLITDENQLVEIVPGGAAAAAAPDLEVNCAILLICFVPDLLHFLDVDFYTVLRWGTSLWRSTGSHSATLLGQIASPRRRRKPRMRS